MLRRRLLAILLDDELLETILLCELREGWMVDDEGARGNIGELLFYRMLYVLQALCEALVTRIILYSVRRVNTAERAVYALPHRLKPAYTCPVVWVVKMSGGAAVVMCRPYQVLIKTYELQGWLHRMDTLHPTTLKAQITHVEIGCAGGECLDGLWCRLVILWIIPLGE